MVLAKFYFAIYQAGFSKGTQMELYEGRVHLHESENTKFMDKVGSKLKNNLIGPNISRFQQNLW